MANPALLDSASLRPSPYSLRSFSAGPSVLEIAPKATFEVLRAALREDLGADPNPLAGTLFRIDLGHRDIDLFDLRRLIHLLKDEFGIDVVGLCCVPEALQRHAERELKLKIHLPSAAAVPTPEGVLSLPVAPAAPATIEPKTEATARAGHPDEIVGELARPDTDDDAADSLGGTSKVLTIDGTVRSGAVVRFAGDIQVFGDVNPGAQVIAGGNVLVFGALKGLAHAGARGDDRAVILAFDMRPTQLRIGKIIQLPALSPEQLGRHSSPELAWLSNGSIVIEPYRGRLPSPALKES